MPGFLIAAAAIVLAAQPLESDNLFASIDSYVEQERRAARVPGVALAIVQGDRIVHLNGFGETDSSGRRVTAQTPFVIGSVTKSFTALAVMQLVEAGKVRLDAPVQQYLPAFRTADPQMSSSITVRHLLHHTSGLPRQLGLIEGVRPNTADSALEDLVLSFNTAEVNPVGTGWEYSNAGYATLGLLVQTVSGKSYERYIEEHILAPLDMSRSFTDEAAAMEMGLVSGHRYWFGRPFASAAPFPRGFLPAGYLMSTAEDMAHYVVAQLNGGVYKSVSILSSAGIAEMQRGTVAVPAGGGTGYDDAHYGMGWFTGKRNGIALTAHPGDTADFHADVVLMPETGWGIVMLMNSNNRMAGERMRGIAYGVASLLHQQQPPMPATNSNGASTVLYIIVALAIAEVVAMMWSAIRLRRYGRKRAALQAALYLFLALVFLAAVPAIFGMPWRALLLFLPDVGWISMIAGLAAVCWTVVCTTVAVLDKQRAPA